MDGEKLERFGEAWDVPEERRYAGHEEMLQTEDLDVVSVCTPSYLHRDHVATTAKSAADPTVIWCEKPIAASVIEAEAMTAVCAETGTQLVVNHSFRFNGRYRDFDVPSTTGSSGEPKSISADFRRELMRNSTHLLDLLVYLLDVNATRVSGYISFPR